MDSEAVIQKTKKAANMSMLAELLAKIIVPIINMILARILSPEIFGIVASINIVTSFTDIFTEAGFQKYLIQEEFENDEKLYKYTNVAFITNLALSVLLWGIISVFNEQIATVLGNAGTGVAIIVAMGQLPITAFSSIQTAIYRRKLEFKVLLESRLIVALTPLIITVPMALLGFGYWSLIIGTLMAKLFSAIWLTIKSKWKPKIFFDFMILKDMFAKSMTLMAETISKWLCDYFDIIVISTSVSAYYLGLYKNSYQMVNSIMTLFTTALIPVLLSSLSRLNNQDENKFCGVYLLVQKILAYILLPLGLGLFLYKELATDILFGDAWAEASSIVGIIAISLSIKLIFVDTTNTVFIARGRPKLSVLTNLVYLVTLLPVAIFTIRDSFWAYLYVKNAMVLIYIGLGLLLMYRYKIVRIRKVLINIAKPFVATIMMGAFVYIAQKIFGKGIVCSIIIIIIAIGIYLLTIFVMDKQFVKQAKGFLKKKEKNSKSEK